MAKYFVTVFLDRTEWRSEVGLFHSLDGPAVEFVNGDKYWYQNGLRHRLDGPAIELSSGHKEYWIDDIQYTEKDFLNKIEDEKTLKFLGDKLGYRLEKLPVK